MSEQMEMKSLTAQATQLGVSSRSDASGREIQDKRNKTRRTGFDGMLKTFLGGDGRSSESGSANRSSSANQRGDKRAHGSANATGKTGSGKAGSGMSAKNKQSLRRSLDKTVPAEDDAVESGRADARAECPEVSPEVAAAAAEAAALLLNIIYGDEFVSGAGEFVPGDSDDALGALARLLGGGDAASALAGLEAAGVDAGAMQDALATANASAEMNIEAVLAALDELLDGMPREALQQALLETASGLGMDAGDPLHDIMEALDVEVTEVIPGDADSEALLATLASVADIGKDIAGAREVETEAVVLDGVDEQARSAEEAAKSSGAEMPETEMYGRARAFLEVIVGEFSDARSKESMNSRIPEVTGELLAKFSEWLQGLDNSEKAKELLNDQKALAAFVVQALAEAEGEGEGTEAGAGGGIFTWSRKVLESLLQSPTEKNAAGRNGDSALEPFPQMSLAGAGRDIGQQAATGQSGQTGQSNVGSILDRIENIERLAEALRMANKGPIKSLTMQLSPPELGKVMLRVQTRDGIVSAYLRVEKPEAASQLANGLQQLRENLKAQGIELGELDIRQQQQQHMAGFGEHRQRRNSEADPDAERRPGYEGRRETADAAIEAGTPESAPSGGGGRLNLFA